MPAYLLIRAVDNGPDPMDYRKGYIVHVADRDQIGGMQVPPRFCQLVISDVTPDQVRDYLSEWRLSLDYEIVSQDLSTGLRGYSKRRVSSL